MSENSLELTGHLLGYKIIVSHSLSDFYKKNHCKCNIPQDKHKHAYAQCVGEKKDNELNRSDFEVLEYTDNNLSYLSRICE